MKFPPTVRVNLRPQAALVAFPNNVQLWTQNCNVLLYYMFSIFLYTHHELSSYKVLSTICILPTCTFTQRITSAIVSMLMFHDHLITTKPLPHGHLITHTVPCIQVNHLHTTGVLRLLHGYLKDSFFQETSKKLILLLMFLCLILTDSLFQITK